MAGAIACAHAGDALQAIDDCLPRLDDSVDIGYARIAARCPDLTPALLQSPAAAWLPVDWNQANNDLSARSLAELRVQLTRELGKDPVTGPSPNIAHLRAVLAQVTDAGLARPSWWVRFKDALRRALTPHAQPGDDDGWLRRWLDDLPATTWNLIRWVALGLVLSIAVSITLNELRVAGMLGRQVRINHRGAAQPTSHRAVTLGEIDRAAPAVRPALLLEFIASRLANEDRLPPARAFTAHELWRRARLPDELARRQLAQLAAVCEQVRFSAAPVAPRSLDAAVAYGRSVLAALDAVPATAPGAAR